MTTRRAFLSGLASLVAAPAVIRTPGLLMPVRRIAVAASPMIVPIQSSIVGAQFFGDRRVITFSDYLGDDENCFGRYQIREVTIAEADAPPPRRWPA